MFIIHYLTVKCSSSIMLHKYYKARF